VSLETDGKSASRHAGAPVAGNLRRFRVAAGLSQGALAQAAGIRDRTIQRLEAGEHFPKPLTIRKLAAALDVSPQQLQGLPGYPLPDLAAMAPSPLPPEHFGAASGLLPAPALVRLPVVGGVSAGVGLLPPRELRRPPSGAARPAATPTTSKSGPAPTTNRPNHHNNLPLPSAARPTRGLALLAHTARQGRSRRRARPAGSSR